MAKFSGYELFRAGQSDTDPISLGDLDNQSADKVTKCWKSDELLAIELSKIQVLLSGFLWK